jgi:hypothetical protein
MKFYILYFFQINSLSEIMLIKEKINKTRTDLRDSSNHDLMIICMND